MKWLKNYKEKECKTWIGKFFQRLTFTWMYKIYVAIALVIISAIGFGFTYDGSFLDNVFYYMYMTGLGLITLVTVVAIVYAWIINPIRTYWENHKDKE
jgi:hypothetical protein